MPQYLLAVHGTTDDQPAYMDEAEMQAAFKAVDELNQKLMAQGSWVFGGGLELASLATVVDNTGADVLTTDGPYAETKEHIGGFWVIRCDDLDAALAIAADASKACRQPVEVRPFQAEPE